jgi:hypothetical protein
MTKSFANDITLTTQIRALDCANCGITFGISLEFERNRRKDKRQFYCPNGHEQYFPGKTDEDRMREERDAARSLAERESRRRQLAEQRAENERRSAIAYKGHATRIRNRIANGVCPAGCNRHFANVQRHIATKHPDFRMPEATA